MTQPKFKIKKGDTVIVQSGSHKGKTGEVLKVIPDESRIVVRGVNVVKKHMKPTPYAAGGIVEAERPIHISNVAHYVDGAATRIGYRFTKEGVKERYAKKTGQVI